MANPNERIKVIVEPDTSGFARELQGDLARINTELTVEVLADTEPATAEVKAAKAKIEANPAQLSLFADTAPAKAEIAKVTAAASKPITKIINATVGPALAKVKEFTAQASRPIVKTVTLITTGAIGSLRALDAKASETFGAMATKARLAAGKMSSAFASVRRVGSAAFLPIGAAVAVAGIELKKGSDDAKKLSLVMTEVTQAVKLFGGQTGINAKQISDLASHYKDFTSISGNSIKSAEAALLKYGVVSKQNLPEITGLLLDTAVGMKQVGEDGSISASFAAKFGRALQDPIKGLSLLARSGVPVTASQKAVIKSLIDSGKTAEATGKVQELLASKFSGAATEFGKSLSGQFRLASHEFEEARRDIAIRILPSIAPVIKQMSHDVAEALNKNRKPITEFVTGFVKGAGAVLKFITSSKPFHQILSGIVSVIAGIAKGLKGFATEFAKAFTSGHDKTAKSFGQTIKDLGDKIGKVANDLLPKLGAILGTVLGAVSKHTTTLKVLVAAFVAWKLIVVAANIAVIAYQAILIAIEVVTGAWTAAQWLLNAALTANPIGLVIAAVVALIAIFVVAWKHSETFKSIVIGAFRAVKTVVVAIVHAIKKVVVAVFNAMKSAVVAVIHGMKKAIEAILHAIVSFIKKWGPTLVAAMTGPVGLAVFEVIKHWDKLKKMTIAAFNKIKDGIISKMGAALDAVRSVKDKMTHAFSSAGSWLFNAGKSIIGGLKDGLVHGWDSIKKWLGGLKHKIISLKGPPEADSVLLVDNGERIMAGLHNGMKERWGPISGWLGGLAPWMKEFVSKTEIGQFTAKALLGYVDSKKIGELYDPLKGVAANFGGNVTGAAGIGPAPTALNVLAQAKTLAKAFGVATGSWFRSLAANKAAGGAPNSQHLTGYAVDFPLGGPATEAELNRLAAFAKLLIGKAFTQVLWHVRDHFDHVHIGWLHKRAGGRVNANEPTIIGESGQEGWIPDRPGMVLSNTKLNRLLTLGNRVDKIEAMLSGRRSTTEQVSSVRERPVVQQTNNIELIHPSNDPSSIMAAINSRLDMFARTAVAGFSG